MRAKTAICTEPVVLKSRIAVTDTELTYLLGVGLVTARKIAENANAVVYAGKRRLNNVSKIQEYINSLS